MSIKIYDGLIAVDEDPFTVAKKIREILSPVFTEKFYGYYQFLKEQYDLVNNSERSFEYDETLFESYFGDEGKNLIESLGDSMVKYRLDYPLYETLSRLHHRSTHTFAEADIFYDVILIPNGNEDDKHPLVLVFGENKSEYIRLLLDAGVVEEYGYWDNSDREDGVSEKRWDRRKKAWTPVIDSSPAAVGLTISNPTKMDMYMHINGEINKNK